MQKSGVGDVAVERDVEVVGGREVLEVDCLEEGHFSWSLGGWDVYSCCLMLCLELGERRMDVCLDPGRRKSGGWFETRRITG